MARDVSTLGNKLGPKLAKIVSQTVIATRRAMMPLEHHVRVKATQDVIDKAGREVAEHYRPLVQAMLDTDNGKMHPAVRTFLEDAISGEHQLKAIGGLLMGSVQGAIGTFLSNEMAPVLYPLISSNPNLALDPFNAAQASARGIWDFYHASESAAEAGFDNAKAHVLQNLAQTPPDVTTIQELVNRGIWPEQIGRNWLKFNGYPDQTINDILKLRETELSPADLALAVLRGNMTKDRGYELASRVGTSRDQFDTLLSNTGEPPGIMSLLEAFRRGFIDEATLTRGILQSRVRDEWIPTLVKLRYSPMTVSDAVNAVVQNHMGMSEGRSIAQQNGLDPTAFPVLYETAGEPLSRTEMSELYNRGLVPESTVKQALRESRIKNKYIDDAFKLHVRLLEPRMLASAVENGALTKEQAIKHAMDYGFTHDDATTLVEQGINTKLRNYRTEVVRSIETLYEDNAISESDARAEMHKLKFSNDEIDLIFKTAEYRRIARAESAVLTAIRAKYISHHIDEKQAKAYMDQSGIPSGKSAFLLNLWTVERSAYTRTLTEAQVAKAVKLTLIKPEDGLSRLIAMGYNEIDAGLLLAGA